MAITAMTKRIPMPRKRTRGLTIMIRSIINARTPLDMGCVYGVLIALLLVFFLQAEAGIRDLIVPGVQTCALPIWAAPRGRRSPALQFALSLGHAAATRRYEAPPAAGPRLGRAPALQVSPPTLGDLRTFKVCGNLTCSTSAFKTVGARVQSVGAHIAIY